MAVGGRRENPHEPRNQLPSIGGQAKLGRLFGRLIWLLPRPIVGAAAPITTDDDEEVTKLTPFEVSSDKDYGYLKTNAATATRSAWRSRRCR
jgi:hypothetical protein